MDGNFATFGERMTIGPELIGGAAYSPGAQPSLLRQA